MAINMEDKFKHLFEVFDKKEKKEDFGPFIQDLLLFILNYTKLKDPEGNDVRVNSIEALNEQITLNYHGLIDILTETGKYEVSKQKNLSGLEHACETVPFNAFKTADPRLALVSCLLGLVSEIVDLHDETGKKIDCRYFSIKKSKNWRSHVFKDEPLYNQLSRTCNANCQFCYIKSNPNTLAIAESSGPIGKEEFDHLLENYDPLGGSALFDPCYQIKEIFNDDSTIDRLKMIREKAKGPFYIVTNGIGLTKEKIRELSKVKPLILVISFNTFSNNEYSKIMDVGSATSDMQIKKMEWMDEFEVPYIASIVATPLIKDLKKDVLNTLSVLDAHNPVCTRIVLPGYTKLTEYNKEETEHLVDNVLTLFDTEIMGKYSHPVFVVPIYRYLNAYRGGECIPLVLGVVKNSPSHGKLKAGDVIVGLEGIKIEDCHQFKTVATMLNKDRIAIDIIRDSQLIKMVIGGVGSGKYPYTGDVHGKYHFPFGIVVPDGINTRFAKSEIEKAIHKYKASNVLLLTSKLMKQHINRVLISEGYQVNGDAMKKGDVTLRFLSPTNRYFGGNIDIMDMCTASDITNSVKQCSKESGEADLIIMPSSFMNSRQMDLVGISSSMIGGALNKPVHFIANNRITF